MIGHPTIVELVRMILALVDQYGWEQVVLFKLDLKAAFSLIKFIPKFVHLLGFPLICGLTAIFIVGMFGWTGTPYAFQTV